MLQLSDRLTGEYTAGDEATLVRFTDLLTLTLESLWNLRLAQKMARESQTSGSRLAPVVKVDHDGMSW
jgi:hypothetical protein